MWDIWDLCGIYMIPVLGSLAPPAVVWSPPHHTTGGERGLYQGIMAMDDDHTT